MEAQVLKVDIITPIVSALASIITAYMGYKSFKYSTRKNPINNEVKPPITNAQVNTVPKIKVIHVQPSKNTGTKNYKNLKKIKRLNNEVKPVMNEEYFLDFATKVEMAKNPNTQFHIEKIEL